MSACGVTCVQTRETETTFPQKLPDLAPHLNCPAHTSSDCSLCFNIAAA